MKLPRLYTKCNHCDMDVNIHPLWAVSWSFRVNAWLCDDCWCDLDEDERDRPAVFAKDALPDTDDMMQRLITAAAARRMGVK